MKKLLFLVGILFLLSCTKDETCWYCSREVFVPNGYYSVMLEVCGMTEKEARQFERDNSSLSGTSTIDTNCWKVGTPKPNRPE